MENQFFVDSEFLSPQALEKKHRLETRPLQPDGPHGLSPRHGAHALRRDGQGPGRDERLRPGPVHRPRTWRPPWTTRPAPWRTSRPSSPRRRSPSWSEMARRARLETQKHFGNTVYLFTPLYIANYCENYCIYCGFNCYNHIQRMKLHHGADRARDARSSPTPAWRRSSSSPARAGPMSGVDYIGQACQLARKYFRMVGLEIYPVNSDEYRYLRAVRGRLCHRVPGDL